MDCGGFVKSAGGAARIPIQFVASSPPSSNDDRRNKQNQLDARDPHQPQFRHHQHQQQQQKLQRTSARDTA